MGGAAAHVWMGESPPHDTTHLYSSAGIELLGTQPIPILLSQHSLHVGFVLVQTAQVVWDTRTRQGADTILKKPKWYKILNDIKPSILFLLLLLVR